MPESGKAALRRHYLALRDGLDPLERALWSAQACRHLAAFCEARAIHSVAAFWPLGSEIDLRPLLDAHPFWTFHFPRIVEKAPPTLAWGPRPLGPGAWGLQEPLAAPHAVPPVQLVLVPGLAFAGDGHRLGYGRGFYDAVLPALGPGVVTLGTGFGVQHCPALPTGPGDVPVMGFADEAGVRLLP
ncbi:5-formyltetrahydrofolate cyclo-ligase [Mesoterricola silvestris]|uniref:5-formyltetrahydrofolate cyclo-ligase n=1 Tax=Mesoterricola silvestris TaxID=2927979 RepID=A0AA48K8L0_9BACT|nr:5-formyltetrahydrofolate cyclo-ligase [Mesoterricola silvestris]BDU72426.1 5-formyltetrahydrofolate cyclo-ligase [Mesoterricola silvestris]